MFRPVCFHSFTGGVGTSTIMHATALMMATFDKPIYISGDPDTAALFGLSNAEVPVRSIIDAKLYEVTDDVAELTLLEKAGGLFVLGSMTDHNESWFLRAADLAPINLLIVPATYMGIKKSLHGRPDRTYDGIIAVEYPGGALNTRDIERTFGVRALATVAWAPQILRCIDAGMLATTLPAGLTLQLRPLTMKIADWWCDEQEAKRPSLGLVPPPTDEEEFEHGFNDFDEDNR